MKRKTLVAVVAIGTAVLAREVYAATQWNVSLWGKRRAFTENV